jgi:hypothetical protein
MCNLTRLHSGLQKVEAPTRRDFIKRGVTVAVGGATAVAQALSNSTVEADDLPESVLINVPYYKMARANYCAPASVQMVLGYLLDPVAPPSQDVLYEEINSPTVGIWGSFKNRGFGNVSYSSSVDLIRV